MDYSNFDGGNLSSQGGGNHFSPYGPSPQKPQSPKKEKRPQQVITIKKRTAILALVIVLILAMLFSFGGLCLAEKLTGNFSGGNTSATGTGYKLEDATGASMTVQEINKKVQTSVVEIKTESAQSGGWVGEYVTEGAGSGVIIKSNGYIMTNNHVVSGASKITVTVNGKDYSAKLVGSDSSNDIAVLKINATKLNAVTYGNSDKIDTGDMAVVVGNPLGELGGSVTSGIISAKSRQVTLNNRTMTLIQTDASVNPGNSGGGMFNDHGQLIGVVVAKSSGEDVEGLGFAIPINTAAKVASNIIEGKSSENSNSNDTAFSGMAYQDLTDSTSAQQAGVDEPGIYVAQILTSDASNAGFRVGDRIYSVDGTRIKSFDKLSSVIKKHHAGDKVKFVVVRDNKKVELTLKMSSLEDYEEQNGSTDNNSGNNSGGSDSYGGNSGNSGGSDSYGGNSGNSGGFFN